MDVNASEADNTIALCLSGGGFRATLFHLGVIRALRGYSQSPGGEMALLRVREIYSVSGGSILAAHLLRHYERYTGTEQQFAEVQAEIVAFARRDVRDRVLRRWGLTFWLGGTRSHWLQREYESLLGTETISDCYRATPAAPHLHVLATSFVTGELCSFSGTTFEQTRRGAGGGATDAVPAGHLRLAYAVAASSSFPPMFPPIPLTPRLLRFPDNNEFAQPIELSDGGVYDNFGIEKFRQVHAVGSKPATLIVSHAGGSFDAAPGKTYSRMLTRNIRASDIMMRRVGEGTLEAGQEFAGKGYALVRIGATVDDGTLEVATQQLLRLVRTDLNAFDGDLSRLLIDHGHRVASAVFKERGWVTEGRPTIAPTGKTDAHLAEAAVKGAHRSFFPLFLDVRDVAVLSLWWMVAAVVTAGLAWVAYGAYETSRAKDAAVKALLEAANDRAAIATAEAEAKRAEAEAKNKAYDDMANLLKQIRGVAQTGTLDDIRRSLDRATGVATGEARPTAQAAPSLSPVRATQRQQLIYIQFAGLLTRAQIAALNSRLKEAGWRTQGASGERTPAAAGLNEVRYSGNNSAAATELADAINQTELSKRRVIPQQNSAIWPNVLEAWISD